MTIPRRPLDRDHFKQWLENRRDARVPEKFFCFDGVLALFLRDTYDGWWSVGISRARDSREKDWPLCGWAKTFDLSACAYMKANRLNGITAARALKILEEC